MKPVRGKVPALGVDFGGVIVKHGAPQDSVDTGVVPGVNAWVAQEGVFEGLRQLVTLFDGRVWIVSKAGPRMQARTTDWIEMVDFHARTGLEPGHVRFCREWKDKERICREHSISHFVDDRVQIMQVLRHCVPSLYLFDASDEPTQCPPWATRVSSWAAFVEMLPGLLGPAVT